MTQEDFAKRLDTTLKNLSLWFVECAKFDLQSIKDFADRINCDPGIILGRLQNDKIVDFNDWMLKPLRHKYKVRTVI